jgi:hypothetical protein
MSQELTPLRIGTISFLRMKPNQVAGEAYEKIEYDY